jgi:hypothetical protein
MQQGIYVIREAQVLTVSNLTRMTAEEESRWNEFLLDPSPKISDAVKNYFQLQLAKGSVWSDVCISC